MIKVAGTSLGVQWLRLQTPNAGGLGSIPSQETRFHISQRRSKILHAATKTQLCCCCSAAQLCPTLCDPMDCSLPGSSVHGISLARSRLPFPSPGNLPDPGIEPMSSALAGRFVISEPLGKPTWPGLITKVLGNIVFLCVPEGQKNRYGWVLVDPYLLPHNCPYYQSYMRDAIIVNRCVCK